VTHSRVRATSAKIKSLGGSRRAPRPAMVGTKTSALGQVRSFGLHPHAPGLSHPCCMFQNRHRSVSISSLRSWQSRIRFTSPAQKGGSSIQIRFSMKSFEAANGATKRSAYDRRPEYLNIFMKRLIRDMAQTRPMGMQNERHSYPKCRGFPYRYIGNADSPVF
jgi:hypothetical protein